jgi:hypothetical protein
MNLRFKRSFYITSSLTRDDTLIGLKAQKRRWRAEKADGRPAHRRPPAPRGTPKAFLWRVNTTTGDTEVCRTLVNSHRVKESEIFAVRDVRFKRGGGTLRLQIGVWA